MLRKGRQFPLHYLYRRVNQLNKTDCHEITEILLKVALNTIKTETTM